MTPQVGPGDRAENAAHSKARARAKVLDRSVPGAGERLLTDVAAAIEGVLQRHAEFLTRGSAFPVPRGEVTR